jgi:hypothetical protein
MAGWPWWIKALGAIGIVAASFVVSLVAMDRYWPGCGSGLALQGPFQKFASGFAYVAPAPSLNNRSDTPSDPTRSTAFICENGTALGPAHSSHGDIDALGRGRFSHYFGNGFIFSTSDNSDPNKNGRSYRAVQP